MTSKYPELVFSKDEDFTEERLNSAMRVIDQRLMALEPFSPDWKSAVEELRLFGLARLNDVIEPIYQRLVTISQIGALFTATSTTSAAIGETEHTFILSEDDRSRFAASGYLTIQSIASPSNSMSGQMVHYNRETGELVVNVDTVRGSGTFDHWTVSASVDPQVIDDRFSEIQDDIDAFKADVEADISSFGPNDNAQIVANTAAIATHTTQIGALQTDVAKLKTINLRSFLAMTMR